MTAVKELRDLAGMFGWGIHVENRQHTFLHGQHMVTVDYNRNGAVREAKRYEFASAENVHFVERTRESHKKDDVRNWLIKLGH